MAAIRRLAGLRTALLLLGLAVLSAGPLVSPAAAANPQDTASHSLGWTPTPGLPTGISPAAAGLVQTATSFPDSVDLSQWAPPVGYQGAVNSCSSWSTDYAYRYWLRNHDYGETSTFAPMYVYSQLVHGNNVGTSFPANINLMVSQGIAHQSDYSQGTVDYTTQPTAAEVTAAAPYKVVSGTLLFSGTGSGNQGAVQASIAAGKPVLLGIPVYDNFESASLAQPLVDVPSAGMNSHGTHAVFAPKYDATGVWVENSWGTGWGSNGWAELSWAFINQYAIEGWNMTETNANGWSVTLGASAANVATGTSVTLTAAANQSVSGSSYSVVILASNNSVVRSCSSGSTCAATVTSSVAASETYRAVVGTSQGTSPQATSNQATVTWTSVMALTYVPISPVRLLDTRAGIGLWGKLQANTPATFQVTGVGSVPGNAKAVTGNVTVVNSTNSWAVYLGPDPVVNPATSTINFASHQVAGNGLTVALSGTGSLSATYMSTAGSTTDLVFDVTGYFTPDAGGATYHPMTPSRVLDTRAGNGLGSKLLANTPATFQVAGRGGIPSNASAVTGNVTVVNPTFSWAVYLGPVATASPSTSTINFNAGEVKGNSLTVSLGAGGTLSATFMSSAGNNTDLVFDVTGYYTADSSGVVYVPVTPARLLDTRSANGLGSKLPANTPETFNVNGRGGIPGNATAVTGNVTVVNGTNGWAVFLGPIPTAAPATSTINFNLGDIKGNGLTVALGGGSLSATYMSTLGNNTDLIFDVTGYFMPAPAG